MHKYEVVFDLFSDLFQGASSRSHVVRHSAFILIAVGFSVNGGVARSEPQFSPEGVYAMFTQSFTRCGQMFPEMKSKIQLAEQVLERYLDIDPTLRAAKSSTLLTQAERKVNAELDNMFGKHIKTAEERKSVCAGIAAGEFGMLSLPKELFEEASKSVGK